MANIKEYRFEILTSDTAGRVVQTYTNYSINGRILKIEHLTGNESANGSLSIGISGQISEIILQKNGTANANSTHYPFVYLNDNTNTTGSPQSFGLRAINNPIWVGASGIGNTKVISGVVIYYI